MPTTTSTHMKPDDQGERDRQAAAVGVRAVGMQVAVAVVVAPSVCDGRMPGGLLECAGPGRPS